MLPQNRIAAMKNMSRNFAKLNRPSTLDSALNHQNSIEMGRTNSGGPQTGGEQAGRRANSLLLIALRGFLVG